MPDNEVTPLHAGTITMDKSVLTAGVGEGTTIDAPSIVYLIETPEETLLVDTSFGDVDATNERKRPAFECHRGPGETLTAALDDEGCAPEAVDTVVLTHLHWDHCYNLDLFSDADVWVPREELAYAVAPFDHHRSGYDAGEGPPWLGADVDAFEGETELAPGVRAFPTPGHTVGHVSLSVETGDETTVVAADAVPTFENVAGTEDWAYVPAGAVDEVAWWKSAREVERRADQVLPGHEWEILDIDRGFDPR